MSNRYSRHWKMSDSECEYFQQAPIPDQKTKPSRKPSADNKKRKSHPPSTNLIHTRKKTHTDNDLFGMSSNDRSDTLPQHDSSSTCLSSFFVNRVANGCERRAASINGEYYVDCKVYKADDARHTDSQELWKKALVRLKFQTDPDSSQWRKLQEFVRSVDTLFPEKPMFY